MTTNTQITGVVLSAIMVLSMVAMAFPIGVGALSTGESVSDGTDGIVTDEGALTDELHTERAEIDDDLLAEAEDRTVEAVIRLNEADSAALTGDRESVIDQLKLHADATQDAVTEAAAELESVEVQNSLWITNAVLVEATAADLEQLAEVPGVTEIHPNHEYTIPEVESDASVDISPDQDVTYGLDQINAPDVWDEFGNKGEGAEVAVLDSGYSNNHQDLPEIHPDDQWQEFDDSGDPIPSDPRETSTVDHGTHVSGTIVGSDDPVGEVPAFGVAPEATLYNGLVLPGGGGSFTQVAGGMEFAIDEWGVDIINMSLGGGPGDDALLPAAEHIWQAGAILVASNGNNLVGAPGTYWSSFGSQAVDEDEQPASFADEEFIDDPDSFFGTDVPDHWPDEYQTPHASAAGVGVLSAQEGDGYDTLSGTSMSAPHHAGMFALMVSQADGDFELEEFRGIALDETREPPSDDPIFGEGISDALLAVEEVGPAVPEFSVGDVAESGEIDIVDAVLIQQRLANMDPEPFNENLADVTREGEIDIVDAVFIQQFIADIRDGAHADVHSMDAPPEVSDGETIEVEVTAENIGGLGTIQAADMRLAMADEPLDDETTIASTAVDLAPADRPDNATQEMAMEITPSDHGAGEMHMGMFTDDANVTQPIFVTSPFFEVTDLEAPEEVVSGNEIEVDATIENTGTEEATQDVEFLFAGDTLLTEEDVTLEANESETVTFEPFVDVAPGTYEHGVATEDDGLFANITVTESDFQVDNVTGPSDVVHGDEITVNATIENVGDAGDEQEITYELGGGAPGPVAVVTPDGTTRDHGDRFLNFFAETLEEVDDDWEFDHVTPVELDDNIDLMGDYESFVINRFGNDVEGVDGDDLADAFLANLDDNQGVVYLDAHTGATDNTYPDAVERLDNVREDPSGFDTDSNMDDEKAVTILEDHEIWTDVGAVGDTVDMFDEIGGSLGYGGWFDDYSGSILGHMDHNDNPGVGVSDDGSEAVWSSGGETFFTYDSDDDPLEDRTEEGKQLLVNMIEYVQTGQVTGADATADEEHPSQIVELEPGESEDVSFEYTVTEDDGIGDLSHIVASFDDTGTADVTVTAPDQIEITDLDAPAEAGQTEEIEIVADLEHVGTADDVTQDVVFTFGDDLLTLTETVTMDAGDTKTVTFDVTVPGDLEPGEYTHGVEVKWDDESALIEIFEGDDAFFEVQDLDAPTEAGQFDTFNVSATIENVGDFEDTQTIEYDFNVDVEDPGDEPELEDVDVGIVDDDLDTDELAEELAERGLSDAEIEEELDDIEAMDMNPRAGFIANNLDDDVFNVQNISSEDLLDNTGLDVYVISAFDNDGDINDFLDETSDDTGVVYMDSWSSFSTNALNVLVDEIGDPEETASSLSGDGDVMLEITDDHPLFKDVADAGETILHMDGDVGSQDRRWFEGDYSGDAIADISMDGTVDGAGVGVNPDKNEVILASHASWSGSFTPHEAFSEESNQIMLNAIEWAAEEALLDGASVTAQDDIATDDQPIQITATEDVTLDGGESETVEFEFQVPGNLRPDTYGHGIFSEDDDAVAEIFIFEQSPNIEVTGHFPEDDELEVGETLVTEATVVNSGDVAGERDINLNIDGAVEDTVTVELDPGEVAQVELETTMTEAGDFVVAVNGQDPQLVTVEESGDAVTTATTAPGVPVLG